MYYVSYSLALLTVYRSARILCAATSKQSTELLSATAAYTARCRREQDSAGAIVRTTAFCLPCTGQQCFTGALCNTIRQTSTNLPRPPTRLISTREAEATAKSDGVAGSHDTAYPRLSENEQRCTTVRPIHRRWRDSRRCRYVQRRLIPRQSQGLQHNMHSTACRGMSSDCQAGANDCHVADNDTQGCDEDQYEEAADWGRDVTQHVHRPWRAFTSAALVGRCHNTAFDRRRGELGRRERCFYGLYAGRGQGLQESKLQQGHVLR